jgi:CelD/BcsL family acetyltransferase involved in cellulose biosynthesis
VEEGVTTYDLGMDMEYKRRWADDAFTTVSMAILPG